MSYIENNLMSEESLVHVTRLHPIILAPPAMATSLLAGTVSLVFDQPFLLAVVLLMLALVGWKLLQRLIYFLTAEFGVTTKRVLGKTGFIHRTSLDIVLAKVEAVRLNQSILGRLLNYGDLEVTGTGGTEEVLRFLPDPMAFRNRIQEQISNLHKDRSELAKLQDL